MIAAIMHAAVDSEQTAASDFRADSAVEAAGDGAYRATVMDAWSGPPGPNGGYIAALILRAIRAEVNDVPRRPRSLTIHYLRPAQMGAISIEVTVERAGRSVTTCTARLDQGHKTMCIAICVLSERWESLAEWQDPAPEVPRAERIEPLPQRRMAASIWNQHEFRMAFGAPPFSASEDSVVGGWIRTREPTSLEPELLAMYSDVWWPAPFPRLEGTPVAPTLDLTVHFGAEPPGGDREQILGRFRSVASADGFFGEDGELWDAQGRLLLQSRQLAILRPLPEGFAPYEMPTKGVGA